MKKYILLSTITFLGLTACGGGGGSSGSTPPPTPVTNSLLPLKIAILDINNNPIPYIDISKIGSHIVYRLQFTNSNNVSVKVSNFGMTDYYANVQAQKIGISIDDYLAEYQPVGVQYGEALKTNNSDDCFNNIISGTSQVLLQPGASCSYYSYATNIAKNYTNKDSFTVPVSYTILDNTSPARLDVVQCTQTGMPPNPVTYNCDNMSKPGFSEQFITYKALPINGSSNFYPFPTFGKMISADGNWYWECTTSNCNKYSLNYDSTSNSLTQSSAFTSIAIIDSGRHINTIYPSIDNSNVWVSSYSNMDGFVLVNTTLPNTFFTGDCLSGHCVPDMDSSINVGVNGVIGLNGSYWWQTGVAADIYDPMAQTFVRTNIDGILGVNADGTIIGTHNGQVSCFDPGPNYTSYIYRGPLLNYTPTEVGASAANFGQNVYMYMPVSGILTYSGLGTVKKASFKVHTENGQCQINLDDYTYNLSVTNQYDLSGPNDLSKPFRVTSVSNVYSGL